jgi:peptidoglycan/LPS O-acetylase OafA/YrhL
MASAMQLYAGFALMVIAIIAIIVLAALVSNLIGAVRRRFGRTRFRGGAHDDFSTTASRSRLAPGASANPASRSDNPTAPR